MQNDDVISVLKDLIEICKDGEEGFKTCVEDASGRHPDLKTMLVARQHDCAAGGAELRDVLRMQGEKPDSSGTIGGALHRGWLDIRTAITGKDDLTVLNECERGEDAAVDAYKKALTKNLTPEVRLIVERQYHGVLRNHDLIRKLRDEVRTSEHH